MNQPPLNPDALAQLIMWKKLPFGGRPDSFIQLDANAAYAVIKLLQPHLAAALPEVTSVEELRALPIGSVIIDGDGDAGILEPETIAFGETRPLPYPYVAKHYLPARVLYRPEVRP